MQGEVALIVNRGWVSKVWYLQKDIQLELLIDLANSLKAQVFAPREFAPCGTMYICHKGGALYAGRPRHPGSSWGEDVLLPNRDLQLSFSAVAITYLWVFTINAVRLHATLRKFPRAHQRLLDVARLWTLRRAVVRAAERRCFDMGIPFRNRIYPIYARELIPKIREMRLAMSPIRNRRFGQQREASNRSTFTTNYHKQSSRSLELPTEASPAEIAVFRAREVSGSSPRSRSLRHRASASKRIPSAVIGSIFVKRLQHSLLRVSSKDLQVDPNASPQLVRDSRGLKENSSSRSLRKKPPKRRFSNPKPPVADADESAMRAAANFGLQLRQEQQVLDSKRNSFSFDEAGVGAGAYVTKALIDDVRQMKADMREMLALLREQGTAKISVPGPA